MSAPARADKGRRFHAVPIIPTGRPMAAATVPGLGGVILCMWFGEVTLWHVTNTLGRPEHRAAYHEACERAKVKLAAVVKAARS